MIFKRRKREVQRQQMLEICERQVKTYEEVLTTVASLRDINLIKDIAYKQAKWQMAHKWLEDGLDPALVASMLIKS